VAASVESHLARILATGELLAAAGRRPDETVGLADALDRVLAADLAALAPVPPFTNSAMDGFAVRAADLAPDDGSPVTLPVTGDVAAGREPDPLAPGAAQRIMTGAPLPEGADAIVPVEDTDHSPGPGPAPERVRIDRRARPGAGVRAAGDGVAVGDPVLRAGDRLGAAHLAAAASVGHSQLVVRPRPRVLTVSTGDELVAGGEHPTGANVPDSNSVLLGALVTKAGGEATHVRCRDDVGAFRRLLEQHLDDMDLVITAGGVSAGAFEVVRQALEGTGVTFGPVTMQPGKPQGFGTLRAPDGHEVAVASLPGNPVSVFVSFHVLVAPLLAQLAGTRIETRTFEVRVRRGWSSPPGRTQFAPVVVSRDEVAGDGLVGGLGAGFGGRLVAEPAHPHGAKSHFAASLARANALAIVPAESTEARVGDRLEARAI
jgi:molybdopterin molybdotransferase